MTTLIHHVSDSLDIQAAMPPREQAVATRREGGLPVGDAPSPAANEVIAREPPADTSSKQKRKKSRQALKTLVAPLPGLPDDHLYLPYALATGGLAVASNQPRFYCATDADVEKLEDGRLRRTVRNFGGYLVSVTAAPEEDGYAQLSISMRALLAYAALLKIGYIDIDEETGKMVGGVGTRLTTRPTHILNALGATSASTSSILLIREALAELKAVELQIVKEGELGFSGRLIGELNLASRTISLVVNPAVVQLFAPGRYALLPAKDLSLRNAPQSWAAFFVTAKSDREGFNVPRFNLRKFIGCAFGGPVDSNRDAWRALEKGLKKRGVKCDYHNNSGAKKRVAFYGKVAHQTTLFMRIPPIEKPRG